VPSSSGAVLLFLINRSLLLLFGAFLMLRHSLTIGLLLLLTFSINAHERHKTLPQGVMSLDIQQQDDTVHLLLGKQLGDDKSLWYQSSSNQGKTWIKPILIKDKINAKFSRGNDARLAVQGNKLVVVWTRWEKQARFNAGPMEMARSDDGGQTWQVSDTAADWQGPHGFFSMASYDDEISLVWLDNRDNAEGFQGLRYSSTTDGGVSWQANQTLDGKTCSCCWNTAKYSKTGELYVLYRDKQPSDMAIGKISADKQWQRLNTVGAFNWDFAGCPHIGGGIAFEKENSIHTVVGTAHEQYTGVHYQYSQDKGLTWSSSQQLGDDTAVHADIAIAKNGQLIAAWDRITEQGMQVVYATKSKQDKTWSAPLVVSTEKSSGTHPRLVGFDDSALLVWTEKDHSGNQQLNTKAVSLALDNDKYADTSHIHAFDKGSFKRIQQANQGRPHIMLFWSETCSFCMKEMALFGELLTEGHQVNLTTIGTDFGLSDQTINQLHHKKGLSEVEKWIFANPIVESLYFDVDRRWRGELPLTFLVNAKGELIKHRGALNKAQLLYWLEQNISNPE